MQRIPPKVWQWSHVVALGIIGDDPRINDRLILAQQAFAAGLLVYGFILGFFSGYLITKLQLGKAIARVAAPAHPPTTANSRRPRRPPSVRDPCV